MMVNFYAHNDPRLGLCIIPDLLRTRFTLRKLIIQPAYYTRIVTPRAVAVHSFPQLDVSTHNAMCSSTVKKNVMEMLVHFSAIEHPYARILYEPA